MLLGITIDNKLVLKNIENLCRMAQYKLHTLRRIRKYLTLDKAFLLGNTFINSRFNYASLMLMFCRKTLYHEIENIHHRTLYHKIEKNHHRTLKVIYQSEESYENLLESHSVSVHQKHLPFLVTKIYKNTTQVNPKLRRPYFTYSNITYNLMKRPILYLPSRHSTYCCTNSIHFRGFLIWNNLTRNIKSSKSVPEFKTKIKNFGSIGWECVIYS